MPLLVCRRQMSESAVCVCLRALCLGECKGALCVAHVCCVYHAHGNANVAIWIEGDRRTVCPIHHPTHRYVSQSTHVVRKLRTVTNES